MGPREDGLSWSVDSGSRIFGSPVVDFDGTAFIGGADGVVRAIDRDGRVRWSFATGGKVAASPVILASGDVLVGSDDGRVYAIGPDGAESWVTEIGARIRTTAAVSPDGVAYMGADDGRIYAIDVDDGTILWQRWLRCARIRSSPAFTPDGRLVVGTDCGLLYSLTPDGDQVWSFRVHGPIRTAPASGADGTVYFGTNAGDVYAVAADGSESWRFATRSPVRASVAFAPDGTLRVADSRGRLYALSQDGQRIWTYQTVGAALGSPSVGADGTTYVGTTSGFMDAISADGTLRFGHQTGAPIASTPAIAGDGTLVVARLDGRVQSVGTPIVPRPIIQSPAGHTSADGPLPVHVDVPIRELPASLPGCADAICSYELFYELTLAQAGTYVPLRTFYGLTDVESTGTASIDVDWDYTDNEGRRVPDDQYVAAFGYSIVSFRIDGTAPALGSSYDMQLLGLPCPFFECASPIQTKKVCDLIGKPYNGGHAFNWPAPSGSFPDVIGTDEGQPFMYQGRQFFAFGDTKEISPSPSSFSELNPDNDDIMAVVAADSDLSADQCLKLQVLGGPPGGYLPSEIAAPVTVDGPYHPDGTGGKWMGANSVPGQGFAFQGMGDQLFATMPQHQSGDLSQFFVPCDNAPCPPQAGQPDACFIPANDPVVDASNNKRPICMHGGDCTSTDPTACCSEAYPDTCLPRLQSPILATHTGSADTLISSPSFQSVNPPQDSVGDVTAVDGSYVYTLTTNRPVANALDSIKFDLERQQFDDQTQTLGVPVYVDGDGNPSATPVTIIDDPHKMVINAHLSKIGNQWVLLYGGRLMPNIGYDFAVPGLTLSDFTNHGAGIYLRTAPNPWGPWGTAVTVYSPYSNVQPGYCQIIYHDDTLDPAYPCPGGDADLDVWGTGQGFEYGAGVVQSVSSNTDQALTLYWVMSTHNPYRVVLMRTTVNKGPTPSIFRVPDRVLLKPYPAWPPYPYPHPDPYAYGFGE